MNIKKTLLNIAENDLKASIFLYDKRLYSSSLYYMQQSVEKSIKSFALFNGIIDEKDLKRKISHNTQLVFKIGIENQIQNLITLIPFTKNYPKVKLLLNKSLVLQNKILIKYSNSNTKFISNKLITDLLKIVIYLNRLKIYINIQNLLNQKDIDIITNFYCDIYNIKKDVLIKLLKKDKFKKNFKLLIVYLKTSILLALYSQIFSCYWLYTRYPDLKNNFDPIKYFSRNKLIISQLKFFQNEFKIIIRNFKKICMPC